MEILNYKALTLTSEYSQVIRTDRAHTQFVARINYVHNRPVRICALVACAQV